MIDGYDKMYDMVYCTKGYELYKHINIYFSTTLMITINTYIYYKDIYNRHTSRDKV